MSSPGLLTSATAALSVLAEVVRDPASYRALTETELLELTRVWAEHVRLAGTHGALAAGEIAHRSSRELGSSGLAQRTGHRTPEELVRVTTGSTARDAVASVRAGRLAHEAASPADGGTADPATGEILLPVEPWLRPVGVALTAGVLSVACAEAIRNGLGSPTAEISTTMLADAAGVLVVEATELDADRLFRRARDLRDEIDAAGIADRETARRNARALRFSQLSTGMSRLTWDLDPESAATVRDLYDRATSPRRGGPRFVSGSASETADRLLADARSTEQIASDTFVELLSAGAAADSSQLLGSGGAVVSVLVTAENLATPTGSGHLAGQSVPVSIATVERLLCAGASVPIVFDAHGQPLDLGREQRLFTPKQRKALAARDGGCTVNGCERPASWTEAHHINHWSRDGGNTDIADGILLCKHHHLLFHNNGWEITRHGTQYWAVPPTSDDPDQAPQLLESKSPAYRDLQRQRAG